MLDIDGVDGAVEFDADEQALATGLLDVRQLGKLVDEVCADLLGIARQVAVDDFGDGGERGCAADRVASKGGAVRSHGERLGHLFGGADGADRHTAAHGLGHGDDIGLDAIVHVGHERAGTAPTGLHFIEQQQDAFFVAELAQTLQEFPGCGVHTAFALHRLDHDADGVLGTCRLECLKIVERRIGEAFGHRPEADLACIVRLAGCGHGTEGAAVEAHLCGNDMVLVRTVLLDAVLARHLDHGLVCLGAGVLEEDLVHADRLADLLRQQRLRNGVRIVEGVHDVVHLILNGCDDLGVAAAGVVYRDACVKIEVRRAVFIIEIHALCGLCEEIKTLVGLDHVLVYFILDVLCGKSGILQFHFEALPKRFM